MTHMQKVNVRGQLIKKTEMKQTDGRTDTTDCITFPANAVVGK